MAEKVLMLALSPTMEAGVITKWHKRIGEKVSEGDLLCEVETDKAVMSYEASQSGHLLGIVCEEGEGAKVGATIAIIGAEGEDVSTLLSEAKTEKSPDAVGRSDSPASDGNQVPAAAAQAGVEQAGSVQAGSVQTGTAQAGSVQAGSVQTSATQAGTTQVGTAPVPPSEANDLPAGGKKRSSPLARTLAVRNSLDLELIPGSGPGGRVVKRDVEQAMTQEKSPPVVPTPAVGELGITAKQILESSGKDEVIPLSGKRRIIAKRLAESMYTAPHYYLKKSVRMDALLMARKALAAKGEKRSFNAFLIKFVAEALRRHPKVNASWQGESILRFGHADIGLAVAQPDGLITPVVRDCWQKGIRQIDTELSELIGKAQQGTLRPEEYSGATFTISNLGSFGIEEFTAIINPPGSAILAVGEIARVQRFGEDDKPEIVSAMKLTLSCDHRVIDGAVGAAFLKDLVEMMEDPLQALL